MSFAPACPESPAETAELMRINVSRKVIRMDFSRLKIFQRIAEGKQTFGTGKLQY